MERMSANGCFFHRSCFRCTHCNCQLKIGGYSLSKGEGGEKGKFFCTAHYRQLFLSNPEAIGYQRADTKEAKEAKREANNEMSSRPQSKEPSPTVKESSPSAKDKEIVKVDTEKEDKKKSKSKKKSVKESKSDEKNKEKSSLVESEQPTAESSDSEKKKKKKESKKKLKKQDSHEKQKKQDSPEKKKKEDSPEKSYGSEIPKVIPPSVIVKDEDSPSPRGRSASLVKTLSQGFEQLEQHAKDSVIESGAEGR